MILTLEQFEGLIDIPTQDKPYQMKADVAKIEGMSDIERIVDIHETYTDVYGYPIIMNIEDVLKLENKLRQG